jgi:glycosyltransferase involved in cell wall biosynthesis
MRCPSLRELPAPPAGKTGWPWTEESESLPAHMPDGEPWPRISVVTPSFNQARFLEATLRSILLQGYPDLEYFVLDGGSTDGSINIIKKYERWLTHWVSEPDGGQSVAINRGLRLASGLFLTWINSDDMLSRNALVDHASRFGFSPAVVYVGDCVYVDDEDRELSRHRGRVHNFLDLVRIPTVWRASGRRGHIVQPEVLFPRQLTLDVGGVDERNHLSMDFDLWGKFLLAGAMFRYTEIPFARFRIHGDQKTGQGWAMTLSLVGTAVKLVGQAPHLPEKDRQIIVAELAAYEREYWLNTGPLARARLPQRVVLPLRGFYAGLRRRAARLLGRGSRRGVTG